MDRRSFVTGLASTAFITGPLAAESDTTIVLAYAPPICPACGCQFMYRDPFRMPEHVRTNHPIRLECGFCKISVEVFPRDLYRAIPARIVARHNA